MSQSENLPVIANQTLAQNEAVENVLSRFENKEIRIPRYQRDADQWDEIKKSLFIESILNRLTVPAFYLATTEEEPDVAEVIDGQQRLTTLKAFYKNEFALAGSDCPYFGNSAHYAGKRYDQLADVWQKALRRYNLTLVSLPPQMPLDLRLEVFRRINEGGTPLSAQDIRLGYYSESGAVRFVQSVGVFNPNREGSARIVSEAGSTWPWSFEAKVAASWTQWWNDTRLAIGQTPSEMFLWFLVSNHRKALDAVLANRNSLASNLKLTFRGNGEEVLDIFCAQLKYEELQHDEARLLPDANTLQNSDFPCFAKWWYRIRLQCGPMANVQKYRSVALLIPALEAAFSTNAPTESQWNLIGRFLKSTQEVAVSILNVEFPSPRGKWTSQRAQLDAFDKVANEIAKR